MSGLYPPRRTRSAAALLSVIVAVAGMIAVSPASTVAAVPKCQGKAATIVGTVRSDVIRGTKRADVIVAKRGNDTIYGGGGNDLICAGPGADIVRAGGGLDKVAGGTGADVLYGAIGPDVLRGQGGNDIIKGGDGNDTIDGGLGFDNCDQGAGAGTLVNCEKIVEPPPPPPPPAATTTDLAVSVGAPKRVKPGDVTFTVRVRNLGPDAAAYTLDLSYQTRRADCVQPSNWAGQEKSVSDLAAGTNQPYQYIFSCQKLGKGASITVRASVLASIQDLNAANDVASARTSLR